MYGYPPWGSGYPPPPQYPPHPGWQQYPQQPVAFIQVPVPGNPNKPPKLPKQFRPPKGMTIEQMENAVKQAKELQERMEKAKKEEEAKNKKPDEKKASIMDKFFAFLLILFGSPVLFIGYYLFLKWMFAKAGSF